MKTGNMNERNVFLSLRSQPWCIAIYEAGFFVSKEFPCVAASPDGVAHVYLPNDGHVYTPNNEVGKVTCSIEIKTRSSLQMQWRAANIAKEYGTYFQVQCGSEDWFKVVPRANRGQLLSQAAALGVDYVLFTESTAGKRFYSALIHVTTMQRRHFANSIMKWSHLMDWATDSLDSSGPPPSPPDAFSSRAQKVLSSHLRLWRALRKSIKENGRPLYPVRLFKCLIQVFYNKMKGGIDGSTQYVKAISGHRKKEVPQSQELIIILRAIKHIFVNTVIALRILGTDVQNEPSLQTLRTRLGNTESMNDMTLKICMQLLSAAKRSRDTCSTSFPSNQAENDANQDSPTQLSEHEVQGIQSAIETLLKKRNRVETVQEKFNTLPTWKRLRLSQRHGHSKHDLERIPKSGTGYPQQICAACSRDTSYYCKTCKVPLHLDIDVNAKERVGTAGCFSRWHNNENVKLTALAAKDLEKKREKARKNTKRRSSLSPPPTAAPPPQPPLSQ